MTDTIALDDVRVKEATDAFRYMAQALRLSNEEAFSVFNYLLTDITAVMISSISARPDLERDFHRIVTGQYANALIKANTEALSLVAMCPPSSGSVH